MRRLEFDSKTGHCDRFHANFLGCSSEGQNSDLNASSIALSIHSVCLHKATGWCGKCCCFRGSAAQCGPWPPRSRSFLVTHNDAPQSVGLLWTSDQLVAKTSTDAANVPSFSGGVAVISGILDEGSARCKVCAYTWQYRHTTQTCIQLGPWREPTILLCRR
jgi:hypothetical protein